MVYIHSELPDLLPDLMEGIADAGAGAESLYRDAMELAEMGHGALSDAVYDVAQQVIEAQEYSFWTGMDIGDMHYMPPLMEGASDILRKATAAIIRMKVRERCEGTIVQERDSGEWLAYRQRETQQKGLS
jgi:hypothetical protein